MINTVQTAYCPQFTYKWCIPQPSRFPYDYAPFFCRQSLYSASYILSVTFEPYRLGRVYAAIGGGKDRWGMVLKP